MNKEKLEELKENIRQLYTKKNEALNEKESTASSMSNLPDSDKPAVEWKPTRAILKHHLWEYIINKFFGEDSEQLFESAVHGLQQEGFLKEGTLDRKITTFEQTKKVE